MSADAPLWITVARKFEIWHPWWLALASLIAVFAIPSSWTYPKATETTISSVLTLCGINAGFLGTTLSILTALPPKDIVDRLRNAGMLKDMFDYSARAIVSSVFAVFWLCWLNLQTTPGLPLTQPFAFYFAVAGLAFCLPASIQVYRCMFDALKKIHG